MVGGVPQEFISQDDSQHYPGHTRSSLSRDTTGVDVSVASEGNLINS